jgi:hypothetical protein
MKTRNTVGQASRLSHFSHQPLGRKQAVKQLETGWKSVLLWLALLLVPVVANAQSYSIDWYKIAGGGGTSTGATYQVTGTIGQPDASGAMTGGNYSLTGGFWSLISVAQTPGGPTLYIGQSGSTVTVYWQNVSGWTLQQNNNLALPANWSASGGVSTANGTNSITITPTVGNLFFRLANP